VRAAAETVVKAFAGAYGEGGRFFVMEWTYRFVFAAGFLQLNALAQNFNDIGSRDQIVYEMLWNQAAHNFCNGCSGPRGLIDCR
jgi:hypothetical protein